MLTPLKGPPTSSQPTTSSPHRRFSAQITELGPAPARGGGHLGGKIPDAPEGPRWSGGTPVVVLLVAGGAEWGWVPTLPPDPSLPPRQSE
jgi:hypothetical protein